MFTSDNTECSTKISVISQSKFDKWLLTQSSFIKNWVLSNNFKAESGKILKILPAKPWSPPPPPPTSSGPLWQP